MSKLYKYVFSSILILGSSISLWFLIANIQQLHPASYVFVLCIIYSLYLAYKVFITRRHVSAVKKMAVKIIKHKQFATIALVLIAIAGVAARLSFYVRFSYNPISDPMTFYNTAKAIAAGQSVQGDGYVAQFPYLAAYNNVLGVAMKIIPDPWLATILLNSIIDIAASIVIYILLKNLVRRPDSNIPIVAFAIWMLNPANVIYSLISIPVATVNLFVISVILISYYFLRHLSVRNVKQTLVLSLLIGVVAGYGNTFRPIFLVVIIALTLTCIVLLFKSGNAFSLLKLSTISLAIMLSVFLGIQKANLALVSNQINLAAAENPSGVSLYVGSNLDTLGQWKPYINNEMEAICKRSFIELKYDDCHTALRKEAIVRYKSLGVVQGSFLFISKLYHQAESQSYMYNAYQSIVGYGESSISKVMNMSLVMYFIALFSLSTVALYRLLGRSAEGSPTSAIMFFMLLLAIGWFMSFMVVESAPRYSTILYPIFIVFSTLMLDNKTKAQKRVNSTSGSLRATEV